METVLLCGKGGGDTLTETLVKTLEQYGKVLYAGEQKLQHTDRGSGFFCEGTGKFAGTVYEIRNFGVQNRGKTETLHTDTGRNAVCFKFPEPSNGGALGRMKIPAAACGMGSRG